MTLFSAYIAWENYLSSLVGGFEADEEVAEGHVSVAEARAMAGAPGTATDKRAARDSDPVVISARQDLTQAKASRKAYAIQRDSVSRTAGFISRELTRRVGREPISRRDNRLLGG